MAAPKLDKNARDLIVRRILTGDSNREILRALGDAGYPSDLSDASIGHYRNRDDVKRAIAERVEHLRQQGLGDRTRRVQKLNAIAARLEKRMLFAGTGSGQFEDAECEDVLSAKGGGLFVLDRYVNVLQQINKEVGDEKITLDIQNADNSLKTLRDFLIKKPKAADGKSEGIGAGGEDMVMGAP